MKIQFLFSSQTKTSFSHLRKPMLLTHVFFIANINDFSHVDLEIHYQNGGFKVKSMLVWLLLLAFN
jgi:hypothetical protein